MTQEENPKVLLLSNMYVLNFTIELAGVWFSLNYYSDYIDHLNARLEHRDIPLPVVTKYTNANV